MRTIPTARIREFFGLASEMMTQHPGLRVRARWIGSYERDRRGGIGGKLSTPAIPGAPSVKGELEGGFGGSSDAEAVYVLEVEREPSGDPGAGE